LFLPNSKTELNFKEMQPVQRERAPPVRRGSFGQLLASKSREIIANRRRRPSLSPKSKNKKQALKEWLRKKKAKSVLWLHGDLQGVTQDSVTWGNGADDSPRTKRKRAEEWAATNATAPQMPTSAATVLMDSPS
jgi:hypothetical protein